MSIMIFEKNVPIPISDGNFLYCNVFRPEIDGRYPIVMSYGVYGKDVHFADSFTPQWEKLKSIYPDIDQNGTSGQYLRWEVPDPERWVPDGFIIIVVDSRGSGKSPGYLDLYSPRETRDYFECIEWAGTQNWSNGKVGLLGISYLAIKQWQVAALNPPHLTAIVPWEGAVDQYRDVIRHGGILSNTFTQNWWPKQILANQHGNGQTIHIDRQTQQITTGEAIDPEILRGNRADYPNEISYREKLDDWFIDRTANLSKINVPILSAANWGGPGMHLRGNFSGYTDSGSKEKWLFAHVGTHYESFYLPQYVAIQKKFFSYYLKEEKNNWNLEPPVQLAIRQVDGSGKLRSETAWPIPRTQWTPFYLDSTTLQLRNTPVTSASKIEFSANGQEIKFLLEPFTEDIEFTGPICLKLWASTTAKDIDFFVALRCIDPNGNEVVFTGAHEPVPFAMGWLRASHRRLDPMKSLPYKPYHTHQHIEFLEPLKIYSFDIEILPSSLVFPKGYQLALSISGEDLIIQPPGRILHNHPNDRTKDRFAGITTLYSSEEYPSQLYMPLIPKLISE
jgi:uncharacterized protein